MRRAVATACAAAASAAPIVWLTRARGRQGRRGSATIMGIVAAAVWAAGGVNLVTAAGVSGHWAVGDGEFTALEVTEASAAQQRAPRRVASSGPCAERGASDLYCLDLHGTPSVLEARGAVQLGRVPSPFGVTVTPAGNHVHELTAFIEGLPAVESLGPFTAYVAWAAT
ncbi:MAG TPA: hypothetical protein VGD06_04640, partial [Acidobacteriota bacterium]